MMSRISLTIVLLSCLCGTVNVYGQTVPALERIVTISFNETPSASALAQLGQAAEVTFSYSPSVLASIPSVSGTFQSKSVREILQGMFEGKIAYAEKGNYVILTKATPPVQRSSSSTVSPLRVSGYVLDATTAARISEASIYNKESLRATISNQYGFFELTIEKPAPENRITFSKNGFRDTVITINAGETKFMSIGLVPNNLPVVVIRDTVSVPIEQDPEEQDSVSTEPVVTPSSSEGQVNMINIQDTLYRDFQVSFIPFVGTNRKLSGNVINNNSLNVLGGYSMGTTKFEFGGLFNIDRGDASVFQAAGLFNANGGKMTGFQLAGLFNANRHGVSGFQTAGLANVNADSVKGPQIAGLVNVNTKRAAGFQVAGLTNVQLGDYKGSQLAGLINVTNGKVGGSQVAGLVNLAYRVDGSQIGFLNVADTVNGVAIGFLSFVKSGYHKLEFSADEVFYTNIALRTGTHAFYNIFTAGLKPERFTDTFWTVGYGIGSAPKINRWLYLNFDLTANQVSKGRWTDAINLVNKLYGGVEVQVTRGVSLAAGVTLNGYVTKTNYEDYPYLFTDYIPHIFYEKTYEEEVNLKMWWGWKFGIRFF